MWRQTLRRRGILGAVRHYGFRTILARIFSDSAQRSEVNLPTTVVASLNSDDTVARIDQIQPDVILIANAPVLAPSVLETARLCAVNFHSGRLPEYGGVASEYWALRDGEAQAWATFHVATEKLDSGDILAEGAIDVGHGDTPETLHDRLVEKAAELLPALLDSLAADGVRPVRSPGPARIRPWP